MFRFKELPFKAWNPVKKNPIFLTPACWFLLQYVVYPLHVESKEHKVHAHSVQVYIGQLLLSARSQGRSAWPGAALSQGKTPTLSQVGCGVSMSGTVQNSLFTSI